MSGAGTPSTTQSLTGNLNIDGLLSGTKWNSSSITYSNPDSSSDYQVGYTIDVDGDGINVLSDGFGQINASQLIAVQSILDSARFGSFSPGGAAFAVEGFTNLSISAATAGSGLGTIRVANSTDWTTAYASYPGSTAQSGDVFLNNTYSSIGSPEIGNYGWQTIMHEVGHALGLKHGHDGTYALPYAMDSLEYSVMTYKSYVGSGTSGYTYGTYSAPQTFMQLDILALQTMYGASYNTNSTNTTYTWSNTDGTMSVNGSVALDAGGTGSSGNKIFATIWDGNGIDTYDLSNFTTALSIDLNPGAFSTIDAGRLADLGGGNYARGNIANALLFGGDTRSLIENVQGGSGADIIKGNVANNSLYGNNGNDALEGREGDDLLVGGSGNDVLDGGSGVDFLSGGTGDDVYYVDNFYDVVGENSGGGNDTVYTVVSYDLSSLAYVETVALQGSANANLNGNDFGQTLAGNSGNNRLNGLDGNDTLHGGTGADTFVFSTMPSFGNVDNILDFTIAQGDKIELSRTAVFTALNAGSSLNASAFRIGSFPLDADDRIIYENTTGYLYYDSDGNGATSAQTIAYLATGLAMTASNFILV